VLQRLGSFKVARAYRLDGAVTTRFPAQAAALRRVEPIVEDLPNAETLIDHIEAEVAPVRFVAAGRSREELVERGTR
jgi:adenylosuccinate synthase